MSDGVTDSTRMAGQVKRYHTWPTIQTQTVAEHSYHVLRIFIEIFGPPSSKVTKFIIYHDSAEVVTGDSPFSAKRSNPALKKALDDAEGAWYDVTIGDNPGAVLTPMDRTRVKVCDLLEMAEFGYVETMMGNKYGEIIFLRTSEAAWERAQELSEYEMIKIDQYMQRMLKNDRN